MTTSIKKLLMMLPPTEWSLSWTWAPSTATCKQIISISFQRTTTRHQIKLGKQMRQQKMMNMSCSIRLHLYLRRMFSPQARAATSTTHDRIWAKPARTRVSETKSLQSSRRWTLTITQQKKNSLNTYNVIFLLWGNHDKRVITAVSSCKPA